MIRHGQLRTGYDWMYRHRIALLLLGIFLLAFTVRAVPVRSGQHYWDETVYLQHGEILAGTHIDNYNEFDFRPPLFSILLAGIFTATNSTTAAHILVAFLAALGIPLVYLLGTRLYNRRVGLAASVILAASPEHMVMSHLVLTDTLLTTVWIGIALATLRTLDTGKARYAAVTGGLVGIAVLLKFTSLVLLPLIPLIIFIDRIERIDAPHIWRQIQQTVCDSLLPGYMNGFLITVLPYLLWSQVTYGNPLEPFVRGVVLSGAATPFLTYITGMPELMLAPFLIGLVFFLPDLYRIDTRTVSLLFLFTAALFLPLQFLIENRELRYLLPALPFLTIMAARGIDHIRSYGRYPYLAFFAVLLITSVFFIPATADDYVTTLQNQQLVITESTPTYEAAQWLQRNTPPDTLLYTNYEWPILAYYSNRPTHFLPVGRPFQDDIELYLRGPGYIYLTERAPDHYDPKLEFLQNDPRFTEAVSFDEDTYLFHYDPTTE